MEKWEKSVAVVTGSGIGIGKQISKDLVKAGVTVIGLSAQPEKVEELFDELKLSPGKIYSHEFDITDPQSVRSTFKWIAREFQTINILINAKQTGHNIKILDTSLENDAAINETIDTNLRGLIQCTREAYKLMTRNKGLGYIVNINSTFGHHIPYPWDGVSFNVYNSTKYALTATTEVIRNELTLLKKENIRITSVSPGIVSTEQLRKGGFEEPKRALSPKDVSDAILYILSTPPSVNVTELTIRPTGEII